MARETLGIGAVAREIGVSVETVRYYERIGLLSQAGRAKGAYRRYGSEALARLHFIRRALELGFSLADTRELLALQAREGSPCASVREKAQAKLALIEQKLSELRELRDAVATLVRSCKGDKAVEHCTILAALAARTTTRQRKGDSSWPLEPRRPRPAAPRVSHASKRVKGASKTV